MSPDREPIKRHVELLNQAKSFLAEFNTWLPSSINAMSLSRRSKLPFKVMSHRESLLYRMTELGEVAYQLYDAERLVAAFTLTRSSFETAAMLFRLHETVKEVVHQGNVRDIDQYLMRAIFGGRDKQAKLQAFNAQTIIDHADKKLKVWREAYESLSEYAHPNFSGTLSLYGKYNKEKRCLELGQEVKNRSRRGEGLPLFVAALGVFKYYYQDISALMPRFIQICES